MEEDYGEEEEYEVDYEPYEADKEYSKKDDNKGQMYEIPEYEEDHTYDMPKPYEGEEPYMKEKEKHKKKKKKH